MSKKQVQKVTPEYRKVLQQSTVNTDSFLIGSWVSFYPFEIDSYEYQLDQMANAGLNFNNFPKEFGRGSADNIKYWDEIEKEYGKRNMLYHMYAPGSMDDDTIKALTAMAKGKSHCVGYHVVDEPGVAAIDKVGKAVRLYRQEDTERYPLVNLFPSYVGEAALGGTYKEYLQHFVNAAGIGNVEYLSHDFYFISDNGTGGSATLFKDMEAMRAVAYENGRLKTHSFPQCTAWHGMRMPSADEMRWNVYAYLAYGFKALSWFNLVCPGRSDEEGEGFYDSIIYRDGTIRKPELFKAFSDLNWEARGIGEVLMKLDAAHAYHTDTSDGVERLPENYYVKPVGDKAFVISDMQAKSGDGAFVMLFNKAFEGVENVGFAVDKSVIDGMEYFNPHTGEYEIADITNGVLTETFLAGEGKLYRLKLK